MIVIWWVVRSGSVDSLFLVGLHTSISHYYASKHTVIKCGPKTRKLWDRLHCISGTNNKHGVYFAWPVDILVCVYPFLLSIQLVGGSFDLKQNFLIREPNVILLILELLPHLSDNIQVRNIVPTYLWMVNMGGKMQFHTHCDSYLLFNKYSTIIIIITRRKKSLLQQWSSLWNWMAFRTAHLNCFFLHFTFYSSLF